MCWQIGHNLFFIRMNIKSDESNSSEIWNLREHNEVYYNAHTYVMQTSNIFYLMYHMMKKQALSQQGTEINEMNEMSWQPMNTLFFVFIWLQQYFYFLVTPFIICIGKNMRWLIHWRMSSGRERTRTSTNWRHINICTYHKIVSWSFWIIIIIIKLWCSLILTQIGDEQHKHTNTREKLSTNWTKSMSSLFQFIQ